MTIAEAQKHYFSHTRHCLMPWLKTHIGKNGKKWVEQNGRIFLVSGDLLCFEFKYNDNGHIHAVEV